MIIEFFQSLLIIAGIGIAIGLVFEHFHD